MEKFIKENWFKVIITLIIIVVAYYFIKSVQIKNNDDSLLNQKKCSEQAVKLFEANGYASDDTGNQYSQVNHYNKKLNKCFMLVTPVSDNPMFAEFDKISGANISTVSSKTWISSMLIDAFSGVEYANLGKLQGKVWSCITEEQTASKISCQTEAEFVNYVKLYMEN